MPNALTAPMACSCGKDIYASKAVAVRAAKELVKHSRRSQRELRVYECLEQPGAYHVTQQGRKRAARASVVRDSLDRNTVVEGEVEYGPKIEKPRVVSLKAKRDEKSKATTLTPRRTACPCCGREWLNDTFSPVGRRCPGLNGRCTHIFVSIDPRDRRQFRWEMAA